MAIEPPSLSFKTLWFEEWNEIEPRAIELKNRGLIKILEIGVGWFRFPVLENIVLSLALGVEYVSFRNYEYERI